MNHAFAITKIFKSIVCKFGTIICSYMFNCCINIIFNTFIPRNKFAKKFTLELRKRIQPKPE